MLKIIEKLNLPKEFFAADVNEQLVAQSVRVHLANQRQGTQSALTRAEVSKTRKKFQKQKGSGNARHGDRKAPIFVGGGVSFAPKPRDYSLTLSDKMKKQAISGAFSAKNKLGGVKVVSGMGEISGKTKELAKFLEGSKTLIVTDSRREKVYLAARNIPNVLVLPMNQVNAFEILKTERVLLMEELFEKPKPAKTEVKKPKGRKKS